MALILNIESATTVCSVALARDGEVVAVEEVNDGYSHAENLAVFADQVMKRSGVEAGDLDAIAISKGPGSYTGLRIGVSLAKGIAFAARKPLIAIDTLQQMCLHPKVQQELIYLKDPLLCPMLDARRMEVFSGLFDIGLLPQNEAGPVILDESSFKEVLAQEAVLFFGNGAAKFQEIVKAESAFFLDDVWPSALQMAPLAEMAWQKSEFVDLAYFEPNYLKAFQATTPRSNK